MPDKDQQLADLLNAAWQEARDLPRVVAFLNETPVVTREEVAARRAQPVDRHAFFTHEVGGVPVSVVEVAVTADATGEIGWCATHPEYRARGHAGRCLDAGLRFLEARGVKTVRTAAFVDSRLATSCRFLEEHGFEWRDGDKQNMVMQVDLAAYEPRPVELPPGYSIVSMTRELVPAWGEVRDGVFGGNTPPGWFEKAFGDRWDFDPSGWFLLDYEGTKVGISAADTFRDPADTSRLTGTQIEWVGVLPTHRGKRLGEALVIHCMNYAKTLNAAPLQLITQPFRVPAVTLYESLGFRIVRHNRTYTLTLGS